MFQCFLLLETGIFFQGVDTFVAACFQVWKACLDESSDRDVPPFTCAIKIIKDAHPDNIQQLTEEAALMAGFDHPNVISLIGVVTPKMIVMPFCKNGDLHSFLQRKAVALDCKVKPHRLRCMQSHVLN